MKAYGSKVKRDGKRRASYTCCDLRNGCDAPNHYTKTRARVFKRRARAEAKAQCNNIDD